MFLTFQLEIFLTTNHQYAKFINGFVKNTIYQLIKTNNPKFPQASQNIFQKSQRARFKANSVETPFYFLNRVINKFTFKTAITKFKTVIKNVHIDENDRSSIGNTLINKPLFFRLPTISANELVKTFIISNLTENSSFSPDLSKPKHFRELYLFRNNKTSLFAVQSISNAGPFRAPLIVTRNLPPIDPIKSNKMAGAGFTDVQRTEFMQMMRDVFGNQFGQPGPPGEPNPFGPPGATGSTNGNGANNRFVPQNVGFFDPFYDGKSVNIGTAMEHAGKNIYFRDVIFSLTGLRTCHALKITPFAKISSCVFEVRFWNNTFLN